MKKPGLVNKGIGVDRRSFITSGVLAAGALSGFARTGLGNAVPIAASEVPGIAEKSNSRQVLCGPMIPLVTHYNRDLSLDLGAYKENLRYLADHGIRTGQGAFLVAGAGGDFPMLTVQERTALAQAAAEVTNGRVPLVLSAQATDLRVSQELGRVAEDLGAYAAQMSPPYYFHPSDDDVVRFYHAASAGLKRSGLMIYNTFWEGYNMSFEVLDMLVDLDRVVSLKWASPNGNLDYLMGVARYGDRIAVIDNTDAWPITAMAGGAGFISHMASIMPEHCVELLKLTQAGKYKEALDSMRAVDWDWERFRGVMAGKTAGEAPTVKASLELCGRPGGPSRPPSRSLTEDERSALRKVLVKIGAPVV
jgi:dihydrodipicolinate synthase/N-acetylneuraminate lyase